MLESGWGIVYATKQILILINQLCLIRGSRGVGLKKTYTFRMTDNECVIEVDAEDSKQPFNYVDYERSLEKVLEQAQQDYWCQYVDINRHQIIVGRNHLWVSAAIIGALSALFVQYGTQVSFNSVLGASFIVGYALSVIAFGLSLYSMPSKDGYHMPHEGNWSTLTARAYSQLESKEKNSYSNFLSQLIKDIDEANNKNLNTNGRRGRLFRWVYRCLILSFSASLLSVVIYVASNNNSVTPNESEKPTITKENNMSNDNNHGSSSGESDKPEVKPPQQPETTSDTKRFIDHVEPRTEGGIKILNEKQK